MATNKPVWGIDLGQNALKAIRLRLTGDTVEAVDYEYIEHAKILSSQTDPAARNSMIAEAMKKFLDRHNISKEIIVVAVPGQHTLARFTKLPPVDKKKIPEIVKYEAQQQIPFDMEEVIWDYQVFGNTPEGTEVGIFAMRREVLRDHLRFLSDLNLEPAAVQSAPLALYNALKFDGIAGAEPAAILDIGAQNSDLIISDGESLWTRNIPIGGNHFTEALLKTFKLSFSKAENLKRTAASSKYARQIFQAMRPVFADLVAEIQRSIGFFTGSRRGVKLTKVIAMGNAFQLPGMVKFIQQNLGMDVVRPTSFSKLNASDAPNAPDLLKQLSSFGVAYGLALQGLGRATITSSLLPPDIAKQIVWRQKTPWFYGAAACMALSAGVIWGRTLLDSNAIAAVQNGAGQPPTFTANVQTVDGVEVPSPDPRAYDAVKTDPGNPLGYARAVEAAGKHIQEVISKLDSLNELEVTKAKEIAQLQTYAPIWPQIVDSIHKALPQEDKELLTEMDKGAEAFNKLIKSNPEKYARKKRKTIFIDKMRSQFSNDVVSLFNAATAQGGANTQQPNPAAAGTPGQALPGFLISIEGHTTHENQCEIVNTSFIAKLRNVSTAPKKAATPAGGEAAPAPSNEEQHFYFDHVRLLSCDQARRGGTANGGVSNPLLTMAGGGVAGVDYTKDPVTGESLLDDSKFQMVFVAILGDKPEQPAAAPVAANP